MQRWTLQELADGDYDPADCAEYGVHSEQEKCTRCCNCDECRQLRLEAAEQAVKDDPSILLRDLGGATPEGK